MNAGAIEASLNGTGENERYNVGSNDGSTEPSIVGLVGSKEGIAVGKPAKSAIGENGRSDVGM